MSGFRPEAIQLWQQQMAGTTLATIAAAVVAFRYAVVYLDILPKNPPRQRWMVPSAPAQA